MMAFERVMAIVYLLSISLTHVHASARGQHPMPPIIHQQESFVEHYYHYIRSPAVVVIGLIVIGPLLYGIYRNLVEQRRPHARRKLDCFRLGISKRSNLRDHRNEILGSTTTVQTPRIQALFTYPVKSCRGVELAASQVVPTGLKYDRLFTFAQVMSKSKGSDDLAEGEVSDVSTQWDHDWRFVTQRDFPKLAMIETELWVPHPKRQSSEPESASPRKDRTRKTSAKPSSPPTETRGHRRSSVTSSLAANGGCVVMRFPFEPDFNPFGLRTQTVTIRVPLAPTNKRAQAKRYKVEPLSIWKDRASAINVTNEIPSEDLAKLKYFLGVSNPLGFFRVDDRNPRAVTRSLPKDRPGEKFNVGFGDAFPLHVLSLSSVEALNKDLPTKANANLDPLRFRANIYISDSKPYGEDRWTRILAGRCIRRSSKGEKVQETDGEYHVACRTARCKLPNVDQNTGIRDRNEPYTTLSRTRNVDEGANPHPVLGMQMIPLFPQGLLRVGDEITVAETGEHYYEKMFS